ncbi:MAG: hypothetical protein WBB98_17430 [Xanthobacteraceae bacterium]
MANFLGPAIRIGWVRRCLRICEIKKRIKAEERKIVPILWLTPAKLLEMDLDLYFTDEGVGKHTDGKLIDDLARSRDGCLALVKKQMIISAAAYILLLSNYFSAGVDQVNLGIVTVKIGRGVQEALLLFASGLSIYTLLLHSNALALDAAIKTAIKSTVVPELRSIYFLRYFPHEGFGNYQPFNLPHITMPPFTRFIHFRAAPALFVLFLLVGLLGWFFMWSVLVLDIWEKARLGVWSKVIVVMAFAIVLYSTVFLASRRSRLPYSDYTVNNEIELLRQVDRRRLHMRDKELFARLRRLKRLLERESG